jgi:hypothetical protein
MNGVRKEERNCERFQVMLGSIVGSTTEPASTENVSSHGLRVRTQRPWEQDTVLIVLSSESGLWARARVVYCQALEDNTFAIGLELLAGTGGWIKR